MAEPQVRIEGMGPLLAKIKTLQEMRGVRAALRAGAMHLAGEMKEYPESGPHPKREAVFTFKWQTKKQKRYFFYALRAGLIKVPYRRGQSPGSHNLKQTWTSRSLPGFAAEAGTNAPYAPYVQDQEKQSRYMKALGWQTAQEMVEREGPTVTQYVKDAIDEAM